jgi:hypothetical protein
MEISRQNTCLRCRLSYINIYSRNSRVITIGKKTSCRAGDLNYPGGGVVDALALNDRSCGISNPANYQPDHAEDDSGFNQAEASFPARCRSIIRTQAHGKRASEV